jgi:cytochrome c
MKNYLIALWAILGLGLVSCSGGNKNKSAETQESQAVEQQAQEVQQQAQEEATTTSNDENSGAAQAAASGKDGKTLFLENGCVACHKETEKSVGPALKDIAAKYAGKEDALITFFKGNGQAIVDPAQFSVMKPNLEITKKMNDADLKALADYIMSIK